MRLLTVAVDFDDTLAETVSGALRWRSGALDLIRGAADAGVHLVVHSCRCTIHPELAHLPEEEARAFACTGAAPEWATRGWALKAEMLEFFRASGVSGLLTLWEGRGKPIADAYVDDLAEGPDLVRVAISIGVRVNVYSGHEQRGPEAVGVPGSAPLGAAGSA